MNSMGHCDRCGAPTKVTAMTPAEFKERFKVGDFVTGWSTNKVCKITAIGEERILFLDVYRFGQNKHIERVAKIRQHFIWRKHEPKDTP